MPKPKESIAPKTNILKDTVSNYRALILGHFPMYNSWSKSDLAQLDNSDITYLLRVPTYEDFSWHTLIPESYKKKFADLAAPRFVQDIAEEAKRRGIALESVGKDLAVLIAKKAGADPENIVSDKPTTVNFPDGTSERLTIGEIYTYAQARLSERILAARLESGKPGSTPIENTLVVLQDVPVPPAAIKALVEMNPGLKQQIESWSQTTNRQSGYRTTAQDGYLAGYLRDQINHIQTFVPDNFLPKFSSPALACQVVAGAEKRIFYGLPKDKVDIAEAYVIGNLRRIIGNCDDVVSSVVQDRRPAGAKGGLNTP